MKLVTENTIVSNESSS